jgi:hypothetical protein
MSRNERQTVASERSLDVPSELGLPLQGLELRFKIVRFSRRLRLLIPSAT